MQLLRERGYCTVEEIASILSVTPQTIRHDFNDLAKNGKLRRHHGGASLLSSTVNAEYAARRLDLRHEKQRIARAVVGEVPKRASVFLSAGTTMEAVAAELVLRGDLKVITNSTFATRVLNRAGGPEIYLAGGVVRNEGGTVGMGTVRTIEEFRCDLALMSCGGIEADGTLLDYNNSVVEVMRAMIDRSRGFILAIDHTKFLRPATVRLGHLREVSVLVTDEVPPTVIGAQIAATDTRVIVAD
jgi:DeoR family transcriptional regulator, glycerol-3-phosphate regulon repressor